MEGVVEDSWSPYKHLSKIIRKACAGGSSSCISELEICLKKYKQTFATILRNPPKNEKNRNQLKCGVTEGIHISGHNRTILLSKDLIDETLIISDMYDLDEFIALELLCTAHRQMFQHPGLPRGLVAILLYYDGRKAIATALRDLFQITSGVSWQADVPKEIIYMVSAFTQSLVDDSNLLGRIIELLDELDITKEKVLLTRNRALGTKKHQNQIIELFEDIRLALATALFHWSAQRGLPKAYSLQVMHSLSKYKPTEASGILDDVTFTMLMALLYSFDTSVLQRHEDASVSIQSLPVMNEPNFAQHIYDVLASEIPWEGQNFNLESIIKFSFALSLSNMRHAPQTLQNSMCKVIEKDEQLAEDAINAKVFNFLYYNLLEKEILYKNEFFYRRVHMIFTDFIDFMHSKITELRGRADETARTVLNFTKEGIEPPTNLDHSFEMLMLCIGKFYRDNRAGLSLCSEYWGPLDVNPANSSALNCTSSSIRSVSLFKFIRLAGDLLPATLFVAYLKMIAGLTSCERSARSAFNLLKQGSSLSSNMSLSWEHFFNSLGRYFSNLCQEQSASNDTIYRSRVFNRGINPMEIDGLQAVLEIIRAVCEYDEISRLSICDHPNWAPLHVLLGLVMCSIPIDLKAEILRTLASITKSKETASQLWINLEMAQVIPTIPLANTYNTSNIETEINQNECRLETYKLTQGILDLMYSLMKTKMPKNLGAAQRKPGYEPYWHFILNGIFLKFYNRNYKDAAEKWIVGEKCLRIINYLLKVYNVSPQDFDDSKNENSPPGYFIMLDLHRKSDLLRLILLIIDEATVKLDEYSKFHGKEHLEKCVLYCLAILEKGLVKQSIFFDAHSNANASVLLSGLNKIILDVNPRTRRPDHLLTITKFVTYNSWLPHHSLLAIKILNIVSKLPNVHSHILDIFTQKEQTLIEIRQGFVECLEIGSDDICAISSYLDNDFNDNFECSLDVHLKEAIIKYLQNCLPQPSPNLSLFLLGFDATKEFNISPRQKLNTVDASSNCTRSLVILLDSSLETSRSSCEYDDNVERIIENAYCLLYNLCANNRTSDAILRYLRSCNDFLSRHITMLPFNSMKKYRVLNQMGHLLKCVAIELKVTSSQCQISRYQHLCQLLIGSSCKSEQFSTNNLELNNFYLNGSNILIDQVSAAADKSVSNILLCEILDSLDFDLRDEPIPKWDYYDNTLTNDIIKECEIKTDDGCTLIDVMKIRQILCSELQTMQNIASGQRKLILKEIESVLKYALRINEGRNRVSATVKLVDAWRQVTEILFSCIPESALQVSNKNELILEILQRTLSKAISTHPMLEISILLSGTVLILLINLRYYSSDLHSVSTSSNDMKSPLALTTSVFEREKQNFNLQPAKSNTLSIKFILKNILEWIVISEIASQKLRINVYAAFLNCLRVIKGHEDVQRYEDDNQNFVSRLDKSSSQNQKMLTDAGHTTFVVEVFQSFGENLIDMMCHDCVSGHDICKMLAFSCVDALLDLDDVLRFTNFIASRGYLSHIIQSLSNFDEELCRVLCDTPENMKCLYVYESKMAMLLRLAGSHIGAELLLANKLIDVLSNMKVYDLHPDFQNKAMMNKTHSHSFIPTVDERFRQILFPALSLCDCIISTLGSENHSAISQVIHFILSHSEMIESVLRTGTPMMDLGSIREFASVTGLIARTTNQELYSFDEAIQSQQTTISVNLYRIQRLMLQSFSRFVVSEATFKEVFKSENYSNEQTLEHTKNLHINYFLEIVSNLALYCRNVVANHCADHQANGILFVPSLTEKLQRKEKNNSIKSAQSLGIVVKQLRGSVEFYTSQKQCTESLMRQLTALTNMTFDTNVKSKQNELTIQYNEKRNSLSLCAYICEQSLYLLWSHLDFYTRRVPKSQSMGGQFIQSQDFFIDTTISVEDLISLKRDLISIFNETFCKQLLQTTDSHASKLDKGFNEALLRRIQSLIQFIPSDQYTA